MSYEEFVTRVVKELRQYLPSNGSDIALKSVAIPLNNNVYRQGIQLLPKKRGKSAIDNKITIDLQDFYQGYQSGILMETVLSLIAQEITDICEGEVGAFLQEKPYDWAKEHLLVEVCNEEMNRSQLLHMPHEKKGNLALRYLLWTNNGSSRLIRITNSQLKQWEISEETLRKDAWENMKKKLPPIVCSLGEILAETLNEGSMEIENIGIEDSFLYVISNAAKYHGASYMFDEELMDNLAKQFDDDLVILPSSVHEILVLRKQDVKNMGDLLRMVVEVNYNMVMPEEVLSNSVYIYDRKAHKINMFE